MSGNKIGKSLKAAGHGIASAARRVKSRFKRFTIKIGAHLTEQAVIKTLKHWVKNSKTTGDMDLEKIFRRGGPCDIMVLKTCIGSIKAKRSKTMITEQKDFDVFNAKTLASETKSIKKCCDKVYKNLKNDNELKTHLSALAKAFNNLKSAQWNITSALHIDNPYESEIQSICDFIEKKSK